MLADTVRLLDAGGLAIADLALRKPTLDDVFLTLTGRSVEEATAEQAAEREEAARRATGPEPVGVDADGTEARV